MLQRALVRLEVPLRYSEGFNPRPRLSLPLPRSVGVGAEDEILCALVELGEDYDLQSIKEGFSRQVPEGCTITEITVGEGKTKMQPTAAVYSFKLNESSVTDEFMERLGKLKEAEGGKVPVMVNRRVGKRKVIRKVDVSQYIVKVEMENETVKINYGITLGGSIRVDELMEEMAISGKDLAGPITRSGVEWTGN